MSKYILGIKINDLSKEEILQKMEGFLNDSDRHYVVLPYAGFLVEAQKDAEFKNILNRADLSLAEGFGVVWASKILGCEIKNRIAGVDLVKAAVEKFGRDHKIFFFGAKEGVAAQAAKKLGGGLNMETLNGFVSDDEAIEKINSSGAQILFVGLGMPKQEKWIAANLSKMPRVKIAVGAGGAFDFISGRVKRAPKWIQKIGFEWFWRFLIQPWRIGRIYKYVIVFLRMILVERLKIALKG